MLFPWPHRLYKAVIQAGIRKSRCSANSANFRQIFTWNSGDRPQAGVTSTHDEAVPRTALMRDPWR